MIYKIIKIFSIEMISKGSTISDDLLQSTLRRLPSGLMRGFLQAERFPIHRRPLESHLSKGDRHKVLN